MTNKSTVSFGFKEVQPSEKTELVKGVFHRVAAKYDLMNDAMSLGIHRLWKNYLIDKIYPENELDYIDMAGGTGDIAFRIRERAPKANITIADINESMLNECQKRATGDYKFQVCDAANIPLPDNSFDVYTISFGLRNVTNIPGALSEAYRVLKPGGRFYCLEFSQVALPILDKIYATYSFNIIPALGGLIAGDRDSYRYLVESIARFPPQKELEKIISAARFQEVSHENLGGGIAAIHTGWKI